MVDDRRKKDDLREAIKRLEEVIGQSVLHAQRVDQLTQLSNGIALNDELAGLAAEGKTAFWVAFVEIDRFKSLNDRFGHEKADAVLQQVADLMVAHRGSFPGKTIAYRAHGDEFFYVGRGVDSAVDEGLETLRKAIAAIKIETDVEGSDLMQCTVSIGWLSKGDLQGSMITDRVVHDALELAVANAKRSRDAVVRFSSKLKQEDWIALRADCRACGCRFAFDVMRTDAASRVGEQTWCPNCGERAERPPLPTARQPGLPHEI